MLIPITIKNIPNKVLIFGSYYICIIHYSKLLVEIFQKIISTNF
jgi:hypothetical protein